MGIRIFDPFNDLCPFCLDELRRGFPDDGRCGHEEVLEKYPHLRFNASGRIEKSVFDDSVARFERDRQS
jgi:hypothetical protein